MTAATIATPRAPARHRVRDILEGQILTGRRAPGSKIPQHRVAEELGVAMPAVREALVELEALGLVEIRDNRGAFVSRLSPQKLLETFDIREAIEGVAVRRCCERMSRLDLRVMAELAEEVHGRSMRGELHEAARLDREFHDRLLTFSGNSLMPTLAACYRWVSKVVWSYKDPGATRRSHLEVLGAIGANDPDRAEQLMREHVRVARDVARERLADHPSELHWIAEDEPAP